MTLTSPGKVVTGDRRLADLGGEAGQRAFRYVGGGEVDERLLGAVGHLQHRVLEGHIAEGRVMQVLGPASERLHVMARPPAADLRAGLVQPLIRSVKSGSSSLRAAAARNRPSMSDASCSQRTKTFRAAGSVNIHQTLLRSSGIRACQSVNSARAARLAASTSHRLPFRYAGKGSSLAIIALTTALTVSAWPCSSLIGVTPASWNRWARSAELSRSAPAMAATTCRDGRTSRPCSRNV